MFRSPRTAEQNPQVVAFEGAVGSSGPDMVPAVRLKLNNFDQDIGSVVCLAEIEARDAFGNTDQNGFGNLRIKTCSGSTARTALTITHDQKVGIGTGTPAGELDVAGDCSVSGDLVVGGHILSGGGDGTRLASSPMLITNAASTSSTYVVAGSFLWRRGDPAPTCITIEFACSASGIVSEFDVEDLARARSLGTVRAQAGPANQARYVRVDLSDTVYTRRDATAYPIRILVRQVNASSPAVVSPDTVVVTNYLVSTETLA